MSISRSASPPKVTICLITYNRARYLQRTLEHVLSSKFSFSFEVLVSDNCSTDDTPAIVNNLMARYTQIRYIRQEQNVGNEANYIAAHRLALGEYCVYLADDDRLIPDGLNRAITYMDQHPDIGICNCPWELWNEATQCTEGLFYHMEREMTFSRKDALALFDLIVNRHIFPEICIFRNSIVQKIMYRPHKAFYAFVHLINGLDASNVAFLPFPYYRSVTQHWAGEKREQAGNRQAMTEWDLYRGGIEYLLHKSIRYAGHVCVPPEILDTAQKMIQSFVMQRMLVALRLLINSKDFISANELLIRLLANRAIAEHEIASYQEFLLGRAAVQTIIEAMDAMTGFHTLALFDVASTEAVQVLASEIRPGLQVKQLTAADIESNQVTDAMLILTGSQDGKQRLVNAGVQPGAVIIENEVLQHLLS